MDGRSRSHGGSSGAQGPADEAGVLDLHQIAELRELGGEDEPDLVLDLIELFLSDAHTRLDEMRAALASGDTGAIARLAHTLKSSAGSVGAVLLSDVCREVEELARGCAGGELRSRAETCFDAYDETERALRLIEG